MCHTAVTQPLSRSHDAFGPGLPPPPLQDKEIDRHEPRAKVMQVRVELSVMSMGDWRGNGLYPCMISI